VALKLKLASKRCSEGLQAVQSLTHCQSTLRATRLPRRIPGFPASGRFKIFSDPQAVLGVVSYVVQLLNNEFFGWKDLFCLFSHFLKQNITFLAIINKCFGREQKLNNRQNR